MYLVFARKYRPKVWHEVIGQKHVITTLKEALSQRRISHAYLFAGPRGTGKTTCARLLAKSLNCKEGPTSQPCNSCSYCQHMDSGIALDTIEIDGASHRGIEEIKTLRENVKLSPAVGKFRIYIIDEVHMLTEPAFNALLKTLEEPPAHAVFVFATTEWYKVPLTIRSRCQCFEFRLLTKDEIIKKIKEIAKLEGIEIEEIAIDILAESASGSLRDAETLLDQVFAFSTSKKITKDEVIDMIGLLPTFKLKELLKSIIDRDTQGLILLFQDIFKSGTNPALFLRELIYAFRDMLTLSLSRNPPLLSTLGGEIRYFGAKLSPPLIFQCLDKLFKAQERLRLAPTLTYLTLELTLLEISDLISKRIISSQEEAEPKKEEYDWSIIKEKIEKRLPPWRLFLPKEEVNINLAEDTLIIQFYLKEAYKKNILLKEREKIKKIIEEELKLPEKNINLKIVMKEDKEGVEKVEVKEAKDDRIAITLSLFEGKCVER